MKSRLPSGAKVSLRKKEVKVSLWYIFVFRTARPIAAFKLGDETSGLTAGKGNDGAGEADRRTAGDVCEPKEDRLLDAVIGGSIGRGVVMGVPGFDGAGEAIANPLALAEDARCVVSTGAGLCVDTLLPGKSILLNFPCAWRVHVPSLSFNAYMCTVRSEDCVATNSFRGSHATPWT